MRTALSLLLVAALAACSVPQFPSELAPILPQLSPEEQQRWIDAWRNGDLPDLSLIPVPEDRVRQRQRPQIVEPLPTGPPPQLPQSVVADARVVSEEPIRSYQGPLQLSLAGPGVLRGRTAGQDIEIQYRLPPEAQEALHLPILGSGPMKEVELTLEEDVVRQTRRQMMRISRGTDYPVLLMRLGIGSQKPRLDEVIEFSEGRTLWVRQLAESVGGVAPVVFCYDCEMSEPMLPGDPPRRLGTRYPVRVFVVASSVLDRGPSVAAEGDPSYVSLIMWLAREDAEPPPPPEPPAPEEPVIEEGGPPEPPTA